MKHLNSVGLALLPALLSGCVLGARLQPPRLRTHVTANLSDEVPRRRSAPVATQASYSPPPTYSAAGSGGAASGGAADEPVDSGCPEEFGQDAPGERDRAVPIEPGVFRGCLGAEGDAEDFFVLTPPPSSGGVLYTVEYTTVDSVARMEVIDGDGKIRESAYEMNPAVANFWITAAPGRPLYLAPQRHNSTAYELRITETLLVDADEPNNSAEEATKLRLGKPHQGLFVGLINSDDTERDVYALTLSRPGVLHIDIVDPGTDIDAEVTLFNSDRERGGQPRCSQRRRQSPRRHQHFQGGPLLPRGRR